MKILLLRHGITEANEKHLYCGSTDLPLSPAENARTGHAIYFERHAPLQ